MASAWGSAVSCAACSLLGLPASASQMGSPCFGTGLTTLGAGAVLGAMILRWTFCRLALVCRTAEAELLRLLAALTSCLRSARDTCKRTMPNEEDLPSYLSHMLLFA